jgi:opacity protein-like surface antigen
MKMRTNIFCALVASALCLATAQASELGNLSSGFQPGYASVLMGLEPQDDGGYVTWDQGTSSGTSSTGEYGSDSSDFYLRLGVGANAMPYTAVNDFSSGGVALLGTSVTWNAGLDLNLALGYSVTENFSLEVMVGVQYNTISYVSGTYIQPGFSGFFSYAEGSLTQIPVMANARYDFNVSDNMTIGIFGGAGFQFSSLSMNELQALGFGAVAFFNPFTESATSFRFQIGADMAWNVSDFTSIGFYGRYAASTSAEFAEGFQASAIENVSFGAMFKFEF